MYDEWGHLPYNPWEFKIRETTVLKKSRVEEMLV